MPEGQVLNVSPFHDHHHELCAPCMSMTSPYNVSLSFSQALNDAISYPAAGYHCGVGEDVQILDREGHTFLRV
jgi:hypothetical protein